MEKPQKRVLMLADFACATGFAQIAENIVRQVIQDKDVTYMIDVVGINYYGVPTGWQHLYPQVRVIPASLISNGDLFGRHGFMNMLAAGVYDIAFILQDTFNIEPIAQTMKDLRTEMVAKGHKPFKFIFYYPIDATAKENWITKAVSLADIPVVYTKFGYDESIKWDETLKDRLKIVPHGIDTKMFYPVPKADAKAFRSQYFEGLADNKFLVTNINRNQPRKDIARTMHIFSLLKRQVPEALLYLHMKAHDVAYNLDEVARIYELIPEKDYIIPKNFDEHDGLPVELVNLVYNASDVIMTTSLGEGWGLSMTEAMAAKRPVIAPNHTSLSELLADGRGILVTAGRSQNDWIVLSNDNERARPIVSIAEYVEKLVFMHNHPDQLTEMVEKAYQHVVNNWTWDKIGQQWRDIFKQAIPTPKKEVIGRNDPCSCGSGKKYKKCHLSNGA